MRWCTAVSVLTGLRVGTRELATSDLTAVLHPAGLLDISESFSP